MFSKTPKEHLTKLRVVFEKLKGADSNLNFESMSSFRKPVIYVEHVVSRKGKETDKRETELIRKLPNPSTVTEAQFSRIHQLLDLLRSMLKWQNDCME